MQPGDSLLRDPYALAGQTSNAVPEPIGPGLSCRSGPSGRLPALGRLLDVPSDEPSRLPTDQATEEPDPMSRPTPTPPQPLHLAGRNAYFIGIGGCGMSGLARLFKTRGCSVRGSDIGTSSATVTLQAEGIPVDLDQARDPIPQSIDLVVASAAIKPDHPQLLDARRRGIQIILYAQALGGCMAGSTGIAVAGTHGKSTTTAMLGIALTDAGVDPSVIVGATSAQLLQGTLAPLSTPAGFRLGAPHIPAPIRDAARLANPLSNQLAHEIANPFTYTAGVVIAEACEYNRSFHNLAPTIACITSVEADHLDVYADVTEIVEAFRQFAAMLPAAEDGGRLLIAHDGAHRREIAATARCRVETIGFNPAADWFVTYDKHTRDVTLSHNGNLLARWRNLVPGAHNATNAATAWVLASYVGADGDKVASSLSRYQGIDRRMQLIGERAVESGTGTAKANGTVRIFDDYGHHPTEVDVTLKALREAEAPEARNARLICIFQPHQHSRTRHLLEEFANSFSHADVVIVPEIYFVRDSEEERHKVTSGDLVEKLREKGVRAMHLHPFAAIVEQLETMCRAGDVVVTMGAGDVHKIGQAYAAAGSINPAKKTA